MKIIIIFINRKIFNKVIKKLTILNYLNKAVLLGSNTILFRIIIKVTNTYLKAL